MTNAFTVDTNNEEGVKLLNKGIIMPSQKAVELLDGALILKTNGLYTKAYFYNHPKTKIEVILIGTIHEAEIAYYKKINELLNTCEAVIFEDPGMSLQQRVILEQWEAGWRELLFHPKIKSAFLGAFGGGWSLQDLDQLRITKEWSYYDYSKTGWVSGDKAWYKKTRAKWSQKTFEKLSRKIPLSERWHIVRQVRNKFRKIDEGKWTRIDYLKLLAFYCKNKHISMLHKQARLDKRDEAAFKTFDAVLHSKNPKRVGIKFGASHTAYQRTLLEKRGYYLRFCKEIRAITLS